MKQARIADSAYVAPGAQIVGDVTLGEQSSVWYNAVLRGDCAPITVGCRTNLQDGVTVGHNAILHSCTVGNDSLIGMGSIVLDGAQIGKECLIGAGAVVTPHTVIPDGSLAVGFPARVKRQLSEEERRSLRENAAEYLALSAEALGENPR